MKLISIKAKNSHEISKLYNIFFLNNNKWLTLWYIDLGVQELLFIFIFSYAFWGVALIRRRRLVEVGANSDLRVNSAMLIRGRHLLEEIRYLIFLFLLKFWEKLKRQTIFDEKCCRWWFQPTILLNKRFQHKCFLVIL